MERVWNFSRKADHKLRLALEPDLTEEDPLTDEVCVECQTSVEFFLKTFLLANKQPYKKYGHNVIKVLHACITIDSSFSVHMDACERLQNYRGIVEYELGPEGFPPVEKAEECREYARQVKKILMTN
jgi:HEPN domain-containing protein